MDERLRTSWLFIESILCRTASENPVNPDQVQAAVKVLQHHKIDGVIIDWFLEKFKQDLYNTVAPNFWNNFQSPVPSENVITYVCRAFESFYAHLRSYNVCFERLAGIQALQQKDEASTRDTKAEAQLLLKAVVFSSTTRSFQNAMLQFYSQAFKAFDYSTSETQDESGEEADLLSCSGCDKEKDQCGCQQIIQSFHHLNSHLRELDLLERLSGEAVSCIIHHRIHQHVEHTCKGNFEQPYLDSLEQWLDNKVVGWLELLYGTAKSSNNSPLSMSSHKGRLYHYMYNIYANTRIQELFNIIIEYPESEPALVDLKMCLEKTSLRSDLVSSLKMALETRLLHPGVNTVDILTAYISAIRALQVLDPTGVLLERVCEPVRKYLRCREDTVRCIVSSLTEDGSSELSDELVKGQPLVLDDSYHDNEDVEHWESWQPDPVDADHGSPGTSRRGSDIISMLVNIYGSKELFVKEYGNLLADRILTHFNYDTEKEIRYLELLKLRFGESQLHFCEVMLKDVADSRRINQRINELINQGKERKKNKKAEEEAEEENKEESAKDEELVPVNSMVLSAQFWPNFREEKLKLPELFQHSLERYTKHFETLKGNRSLNWKTHLGLVTLELELKDHKIELVVSPVHATIIWHFQEKPRWTVEELSAVMQMPTAAIRRKIAFWQSHGLLKEESTDTFLLVEEQRGSKNTDVVIVEEDENESAMASASDQREEEMQVVWSYIVGMLTNLETLPLDRIHSMLKMFALQGPSSECSIGELKAFLDKKVKEQKLLCSSGVYRLPKPGS